MGTQNKEIKIALDIQAKIDKASSQIGALKKQIDNFELSKGLASDFAKEFKNIEHELAELQRKTASGEINLIDAKSAEKEIDKIEKRWAFLLSKIGGDGFLEKGLKTDAQAMAALESLAKSYANGIKEAEAQEARLNKKLDEAKQKQKELAETQKEQKVVKASELEDQKAQLAILEKQEKAAKKARDEAEKALRAKVEESGGKYSMDEISRKGSNLRKTDAYKTFRDAQSAYDSAKASTKAQKTNVGSMVTKEMQVAEAKAAQEAIDKATEALDNYRKTSLATAKEDAFEKAKESLKSIAEFKDIDWEGLDIDMSEIKSVEDLEKALAKLRTEADKRANDAIKEMETSTKEAGQGFKVLEEDIKNAKEGLEGLDEQARQTEAFEARVKQFLGMAGAVELLRRALRQAFETTKELDAAMTEMAVVTDLEVGDYWKQLPDHTKRASELGVAIHSVYEAETLYYQQGLKTTEAQELANTTLRMARIAGLDAAEATDKMTAALRGFNMELNEASAEKVADVYSELAAITAADVNEISSAMTKTASIASSAGMEFETTAAFLSQIIETTRESAETAGTAMKTVIARFSEVKKLQGEGLLTGSDEEGEVIDVNKIQTALRSVGISMNEFFAGTEGLDSIFLKLAEKWDTLDVKTQRYIATTAAGSRQQSRFIAMMSDYARTQELVSAANNSAGASQKQYEKTLESLESKLAQLKNAWDEFSMGILQSDLVKFGVDALTTFLEIINKATSAFDGLGGSITKVLTTVALFKLGQKVFDKIKQPLSNFFAGIVKDVYTYGMEAGKSFAQGASDAKKTVEQQSSEEFQQKLDASMSKKETTKKDKFYSAVGVSKIQEGKSTLQGEEFQAQQAHWDQISGGAASATKNKNKIAKAARQEKVQRVKETESALMGLATDGKTDKNSDQYKKAKKDMEEAQKALVDFDETQESVQKTAQEGWNKVGEGVQQVGGAVTGLGIGISMIGGIFDQLGLEGWSEGFTILGNAVTFLGGGISMIGTLIPVVAKIATAAGISVQAAWWWVVIIVAAVAALVVGVVALAKAAKDNKLENRMAAAAEATEKAREEAQAAKEAYDDLLSDRSEYDEMQKNLENLTYGTKEWKEALHEANQQVLDLITTYPELAKYMTRGDDGQLVIRDEGWDALIEQQKKTVANTQNAVLSRQMDEQKLKIEEEAAKYTRATTVYTDSEGHAYTNEKANPDSIWGNPKNDYLSKGLRSALEEIYITQNSSLEEQEDKVAELSKQFGLTEEAIKKAGQALEEDKDKLIAIADQTENIARASLTAQASENILNNKFGDEVIDAFAQSVGGDWEQDQIDEKTGDIKGAYQGWFSNGLKTDESFKSLANEYNVDLESGNDKQNLRELYAAMTGKSIQDVKDSGMTKADLAEAIAEMQVNNDRGDKMDKYLDKIETLAETNKEQASNIAGIFSDDGRSMTADFAASLMTDTMDKYGKGGELSDEAMLEQAQALNYKTVDEWAAAVGKTTEELKKETEENVRKAMTANTKAFSRLNGVLGTSTDNINRFGSTISLTIENTAGLADKLVNATQISGVEGGKQLKEALDNALDAAGPKADQFANILNGMNWNSADEWEKLPSILNDLGIDATNSAFEELIGKVQEFGVSIKMVDIDSLAEKIQGLNDLIKAIQTGEQGRTFDEEAYNKLIEANEDLADKFVKVGDQFHYIGGSMEELGDALYQMAYQEALWGAKQVELEKAIAGAASAFDKTKEGQDLRDNKTVLTRDDKVAYLDAFVEHASTSGVQSLQFLTDASGQSVGMSFGSDLEMLGDETINKYYDAVQRAIDRYDDGTLQKELGQKMSAANIALYTASNVSTNLARSRDSSLSEAQQDEYRKAVSIQATESGNVAESVIARYNELIAKDMKDMSGEEKAELQQLETVIEDGVQRTAEQLEKLQEINGETQKVAQALQDIRQHEIDKLSDINNSINDANQSMVDKLQQQINENRKQRQNEKTEQAISDKQSQLAYLMADSSGAGMLQAQTLREQILAEQQTYQDDLIDQSLQKLSDDNAAAAEQRERQIAILEAQLAYAQESGELMREAEAITIASLNAINNGVNPLETEMYHILSEAESINGGMATDAMIQEFQSSYLGEAAIAANSLGSLKDNIPTEEQANKDQLAQQTAIQTAANAIYTYLHGGKDEDGNDVEGLYDKEKRLKEEKEDNQTARNEAIKKAVNASKTAGGVSAVTGAINNGYETDATNSYLSAKDKFIKAGGDETEFDQLVREAGGSTLEGYRFKAVSAPRENFNMPDAVNGEKEDFKVKIDNTNYGLRVSEDSFNDSLGRAMKHAGVPNNSVVKYGEQMYYYTTDGYGDKLGGSPRAFRLENEREYSKVSSLTSWTAYATGGLADFTGPAWLDGTKSRPELVLNQRDTQNFIQLKDILSEIMSDSSGASGVKSNTGDNYYNIEISVEELKDDYDVEQLANKIRSMLVEDATYRNVNAISHIR